MTSNVFPILVVGLALGLFLATRYAKNDFPARFGWAAAGAVPGAAVLVGEPKYVFVLLLLIPFLVWRNRRMSCLAATD